MVTDGIPNLEQSSGNTGEAANQDQINQFDIDFDRLTNDVSGEPSQESGGSDKTDTSLSQTQEPEIDEKFKHLPPEEARYRTIQSRYDKLYNLHQQIVNQTTEYEKIVNLFDQMLEDENLLLTFVNQIKPGIIPQRDFKDLIRERVVKEFGEDYKPTLTRLEAERDDPGGKDWKYYKLLDELEKQYSQGSPQQAKTVQEYLEQKKKQKEQEQIRMKQEYEAVKTKMKATDEELQAAIQWGQNISLEKLLIVHRYLRKVPNKAGVSIETAPGKSIGNTQREQFLKSIFGNNIQY